MANSWDVDLAEAVGEALGEEAMAEDVNVLLGPGMNIKRSPLCGRNFEYFSEDPYLAGKMAAAYVRGIQSKGVASCIKHFAVNSQEERRMAMNAVVDERTLREIYLTGFEIAVKESAPKAIMTSYNMVNGVYANEDTHLLKDILRDDWGFAGMVVTDWGGSNSHIAGVKAGSELEMPAPGLGSARELIEAVKTGVLSEKDLDDRVDKLLEIIFDVTDAAQGHSDDFDREAHHTLARRAATESAVLLKNEGNILPLARGTKVAVVGDFAFQPRYQGAGSSLVNATKVETIEECMEQEIALSLVGMGRGYRRDGAADEALRAEAVRLAMDADVVLFFFGLNEISESEGLDRTHLRIPQNQIDLLEAVAQENENVIGILSAGSAIEMPWEPLLKGLVHFYLTGQAGASAMLDILTGRANPSGKLAETYALRYEDIPSGSYYPAKERNSEYRESIFVGYRYFTTADVPVRYPFGYGLSYTMFSYDNLAVSEDGARFTVTNVGERAGAEVAQLYVSRPDSGLFRAKRELKGFGKVYLKPGESRELFIPFDEFTFRYWNAQTNGWETESGSYRIQVGGCSDNLPLQETYILNGTDAPLPYDEAKVTAYRTADVSAVGDEAFAELLGHAIPDGSWGGELTENDAICQMKYAKSGLARFVFNRLEKKRLAAEQKGKPDLNILFIYNMPFRAIAKMTAGAVDMQMVGGMVRAVNGHFWSGLRQIIGGYFRNRRANKEYEKLLTEQ